MLNASLLLDPVHRVHRMHQVLYVAAAGVGFSAMQRLVSGKHGMVLAVLLATLLMLGLARWLLKTGRIDIAAAVMLGSLTAMLSYFMGRGAGLRDVALLGFPGILVFAALLGNRRLFLVLLGACLTVCVGVGFATVQGWREAPVRPLTVSEIIDVCVILAVSSFSIALMANDLGKALQRLAEENRVAREAQQRIEHLASHDVLTGLPNRVAARQRFDAAVARARLGEASGQGGKVALLYVDLDQFKNVNDSLGHPAGDEMLRSLASRLAAPLGEQDSLSRLGGDEFLALLAEAADGEAVAEQARRLLAAAAMPLLLQGIEVRGGASIGIAMYPDDGEDFDSLLKKADIAMYRAKSAGRNTYRSFDAQMNAGIAEHLLLVDWIRQALVHHGRPLADEIRRPPPEGVQQSGRATFAGEFELHYQPQIDLASGRIIGAEALLRWRHPQRGMISPAHFIPVAEQSGQIVELGEWVIAEACRRAASWRRDGLGDLVISVNLSPVQARRGDLEGTLNAALQASGLPPHLLELELTETLLIEETDHIKAMLQRLHAKGISFAIDDFGTGYSNLAYLQRFEVERLKIDQSFIRRLTMNANDEAIVSAILQMAQALKLSVIAEGVEDAATLARLREMGCEQGQGYHWSPALPPDKFLAFVKARAEAACPA